MNDNLNTAIMKPPSSELDKNGFNNYFPEKSRFHGTFQKKTRDFNLRKFLPFFGMDEKIKL